MTTTTTTNTTAQAADQINDANKNQSSQALQIQTYANSVLNQPAVDFSGSANLETYQTDINNGLTTAKDHATNYLNVIQPDIIKNITSISNYYALHNAVATTLPDGSTQAEWDSALGVLKDQSSQYETDAAGVVTSLQGLHKNLTGDSSNFSGYVTDLNSAVNGDNGVLDSINGELSTMQSKIDGAIAGIAISSLAIVGGAFVTAVGAVTDFVTAGASTPLVVGGLAIVALGVGGEVASAITLSNMNDQKAKLLNEKASLKAEVKLASGMSTAYGSLTDQIGAAVTAASNMQNAWSFLKSDLDTLVTDLNSGINSADMTRQLFLTAANTTIQTVTKDIDTVKGQMTGVQSVVAPAGQTVGQAAVSIANTGTGTAA